MFADRDWIGDRTKEQDRRFYQRLSDLIEKKAKLVIIEIGAGLSKFI
jgi:hypothetical protein